MTVADADDAPADQAEAPQSRRGRGRRAGSTAMPLTAHLRELRNRLAVSALFITAGVVVGWIYYDRIFAWLSAPFAAVVAQARAEGRQVTLALTGVADPFVLQLQVAAVTGLILAAPFWLWQLWRFVTPGLHRHERRWALAFVFTATPLFIGGAAVAYWVLPVGLELLFGFTPQNVENIVSVDRYLGFFLRTVIVFGLGFLAPLMLVLLNFAGILSAQRLIAWWRWIIFIVCIFAAVATPTGDPINMALLAGPILILIGIAIVVAWLNDRRRSRRADALDQWADDEISPIEP